METTEEDESSERRGKLHFEMKLTLGNVLNLATIFGAVIFGLSTRDADLKLLRVDSIAQDKRIERVENDVREMQQHNSKADADLEWIKSSIKEMQRDVKDIAAHLRGP